MCVVNSCCEWLNLGRGTPFHQNGYLARKTMFLTGFWIVGILSLGQNLFKNVHFLVPSDVSKKGRYRRFLSDTISRSVTCDNLRGWWRITSVRLFLKTIMKNKRMNIYSSEIAHTLFISFVVDTFELKAIHEKWIQTWLCLFLLTLSNILLGFRNTEVSNNQNQVVSLRLLMVLLGKPNCRLCL